MIYFPHPNKRKLKPHQVRMLRRLAGRVGQARLAAHFAMSQSTVSRIIRGGTYREVAG